MYKLMTSIKINQGTPYMAKVQVCDTLRTCVLDSSKA